MTSNYTEQKICQVSGQAKTYMYYKHSGYHVSFYREEVLKETTNFITTLTSKWNKKTGQRVQKSFLSQREKLITVDEYYIGLKNKRLEDLQIILSRTIKDIGINKIERIALEELQKNTLEKIKEIELTDFRK